MGAGASLSLPQHVQDDELMLETYKKIRVLFKQLDKAGHGLIQRSDFYDVCETVPGHFVTPDEVQKAFQYLDRNHNGSIEEKEFVNWWQGVPNSEEYPTSSIELRMEAFRKALAEKHDIGYGFSFSDWSNAEKLDPKQLKQWNASQVFLWMITCKELKVIRHEIKRDQWKDIDGETLLELTDDDFKQKGILGYHIKKLRHAINQFFNGSDDNSGNINTGSSNSWVDNESNNGSNTRNHGNIPPSISISSSQGTTSSKSLVSTPRKPMKSPMHGGNGGGSFKWKKGDLLGQGAYGRVYSGMDLNSGVSMAVKEMTFSKDNQKEVEELKNEIILLRKLTHPHIVQYFGAEIPPDTNNCIIHIFTELMPQGSLLTLLKKYGTFSESMTQNYTRQMVSGLIYLHEKNIIHRDIKPANVLVNEAGIVKLADFGASKKMSGTETVAIENTTLKGTPYFMAPEVLMQKGHGRKADVWSLGATVVQLISGDPPWKVNNFDSVVQLMCHVAQDDDARPVIPDVEMSKDLYVFIDICFQRDVNKRPTSKQLGNHPFVQLDEKDIYMNQNNNDDNDQMNNTIAQIERSLSNGGGGGSGGINGSSGDGTMIQTMDDSVDLDMSFSVVSDGTTAFSNTNTYKGQEEEKGSNHGDVNPFARNGAFANQDGNVVAANTPKRRNQKPLITTVDTKEKKKKKKKKRKNRPGMSHYADDSSDEDNINDNNGDSKGQHQEQGDGKQTNLWKEREERPINSSIHRQNVETLNAEQASKAQEEMRKAELAKLQKEEIANYKG
jgi:serine/threonine protein kinase